MEGRDKKGRFAKGNKIGHRFSNRDATESQSKAVQARKENAKVADAVRRVLSEPSQTQGKTRMDDFVEKAIYKVFTGDINLGDLERLQRILGETAATPDTAPQSNDMQHTADIDQRIETIRAYLEQEKHLTNVDDMTIELLRYDLAILAVINGKINQSISTSDRYGATVPSQFLRERDRVIKRIMEYEKKLGLSPYDRKKLNATDADSGNPFDAFLDGETSEMTPDDL